ncbi:WD-40 repeat-containing protein [Streptomyces sp. 1114.5]|uniref:caspase, EACC1-associated type n=1 Tax=Streptomyces sp. 1114.5 TaxID=1938830 RepID=UPI000EACD36E|nr:caspase family protein [Streptomyces sp. 1114.5]RKT09228.1 WD-40 repeat-containing protein [Streptomyces sp. 1114.5]
MPTSDTGGPRATPAGPGNLPLSLPGARALIIGTGTHVPRSVLPDVPAVAETVRAISEELVARCGLAPDHVRTVIDPKDPLVLGNALTATAEAAESVLLVYYVGHGLVGLDGELHLATRTSDHLTRGLAFRALRYSALREALFSSRARSIVLVLDCCYSGRAAPVAGAAGLFEASYPGGGFLLASAAPEELALAPVGSRYTAFSGELLRLLREGDPAGPPQLTLGHIHRHLARALPGRGFPEPYCRSEGRAGDLVLTANPAYTSPPEPSPPAGPDEEPGAAPELDTCPYRGLAPFGPEDARFFFGRERLTAELVARVSAKLSLDGPIVLVGPSGAGKSSLLRAGLLPTLDRGLPGAEDAWRWPRAVITPGEHPLSRLAAVLADLLPGAPGTHREALLDALTVHPESIADPPADGSRLLLVVDQFEELFTACKDEQEREAFIRALSALCSRTERGRPPRAVVLLGLRADFYGHCAAYPALHAALKASQVLVGPMLPEELRDAVEKPARLAGLRVEQGLVALLLQDLRTRNDERRDTVTALPLLSHALLATWQKRTGRVLTLAGYQASGGIWHAVRQTAEDTYQALAPEEQRAAQQILLQLVHVVDGAEDTRRRAPLVDLGLDTAPAAHAALDALVRARLVVVDDGHAELVHEAVLRAWKRLADWIREDRAGLVVRQRLHDAAKAWEQDGRDEGALYRGVRLAAARQWIEESAERHGTVPVAREFVTASLARQAAEQRAARRRTTRLRVLAATLAVLLMVAVTGVGAAVWQNQVAGEQRDLLASKVAAEAADRLRMTDPTLALQLALSARHIADTPEARSSVYNAALAPYYTPIKGHTDTVRKLAVNAERHLLVSAGRDHTVRLWDLSDSRQPRPVGLIDTHDAGLALSSDGRLLATVNTGDSVQLWDVSDPANPVAVATLANTHGSLAFSPDGHALAAVDQDRSELWNLTDPRQPVRAGAIPPGTGQVQCVAFSSDGRLLAFAVNAADGSYAAELWNVADLANPARTAVLGDSHALSLTFSPRGPLLAVGSTSQGVRLWDTTDPARPDPVTTPNYTADPPYSTYPVEIATGQLVGTVVFSPDGRTLALGASNDDGYQLGRAETVDIADPHQPAVLADFPTPGMLSSVQIGDRGSLFSAGAEPDIRHWYPPIDSTLPNTRTAGGFSPEGRVLAWATDAHIHDDHAQTYRLWRTNGPYEVSPAGTLKAPNVLMVNERTLLSYNMGGPAQLWDITDPDHPVPGSTLNGIAEYVLHSEAREDAHVAVADGLLALDGSDGLIHLWDVGDPNAAKSLSAVQSPQPPGRLLLDKRKLVSIDQRLDRRTIDVWDLSDPSRPVASPSLPIGDGVAFESSTSDLLAVATGSTSRNPKSIELWNLDDPAHPDHAELLNGIVNDLTLSPNGRTLAVTTDKTIDLWDVSDIHHPTKTNALTVERPGAIGFSPDGRVLVSFAKALRRTDPLVGQFHLWRVEDPRTATEIGALTLPSVIETAEFSPDGQTLLIGKANDVYSGEKGRAYLIDPDIDRVTARLCDLAGGTITADQWHRYFPGTPYRPPCR